MSLMSELLREKERTELRLAVINATIDALRNDPTLDEPVTRKRRSKRVSGSKRAISEETRKKLSESAKARWAKVKGKK